MYSYTAHAHGPRAGPPRATFASENNIRIFKNIYYLLIISGEGVYYTVVSVRTGYRVQLPVGSRAHAQVCLYGTTTGICTNAGHS